MNLREQILRDEAMALYVGCSLEVMKGLEVQRSGSEVMATPRNFFG
jgi:hypothetical protein